jgi:hypothetical protein
VATPPAKGGFFGWLKSLFGGSAESAPATDGKKDEKARTGRNPQTGETIQVPASKAVKLTPGATLKKAAKGG